MKQINCPYCGSTNINNISLHKYDCKDCECHFEEVDIEFEDLRHKISAMISAVYGSEEKPFICKKPIVIAEDESQGLAEVYKPKVISMFHDQEGIIWLNIEDYNEPIEFDWLTLSDAKAIWEEIKEYDIANTLVNF